MREFIVKTTDPLYDELCLLPDKIQYTEGRDTDADFRAFQKQIVHVLWMSLDPGCRDDFGYIIPGRPLVCALFEQQ